MAKKYQPLQEYLTEHQITPHVRMTFDQITEVIRKPLPRSAFNHREWWANQQNIANRPHVAAWVNAGFEVDSVHQEANSGWVEFVLR